LPKPSRARSLDERVEHDRLVFVGFGPFRRLGPAADATGGEKAGEEKGYENGAGSHDGRGLDQASRAGKGRFGQAKGHWQSDFTLLHISAITYFASASSRPEPR
jgi:hypothetical protein